MTSFANSTQIAPALAAPMLGMLGEAERYSAPLSAILGMAAARAGQDTALVWPKGSGTFGELDAATTARAEALSQWFEARFKRPIQGERIGVFVKKDPGAVLLIFAALRAGAVVVPLNPALKADQLQHISGNCGMAAAFAPQRIVRDLGGDTLWVAQDETDNARPGHNDIAGWAALNAAAFAPDVDPASTALLFYTSGSTGQPKGVMVSHQACVLGAASVAHYLSLSAADRVLALLPLSFDYGFNQIVSTWFAGGRVILHDFFLPGDVVKTVARNGVTGIAAVPPLWHLIADTAWADGAASSVRYITNSGGSLTAPLQRRLRDVLPSADIYAMYGLTEAFRSTFMEPSRLAQKPTSIGRAIPFADVFIVTPEGRQAKPGEAGELMHAGPLVAQGYWNDPERTAKRFRRVPDALKPLVDPRYHDRCVFSGDKAQMDSDGDLHFVGRDDDMIKVLGNRLSPQEIEDCVCQHSAVQHAVAFGLSDDRLGAKICLVLENRDEDMQVLGEALAMLKQQLPGYAQPSFLLHMPQFNRTPNGKLDRPAIKDWAKQQIAEGHGAL